MTFFKEGDKIKIIQEAKVTYMSKNFTFTIRKSQSHLIRLIENTPLYQRSKLIQEALDCLIAVKKAFGEDWEEKVSSLEEPSWIKELKEELLKEEK